MFLLTFLATHEPPSSKVLYNIVEPLEHLEKEEVIGRNQHRPIKKKEFAATHIDLYRRVSQLYFLYC